jgi:hypothetical protein
MKIVPNPWQQQVAIPEKQGGLFGLVLRGKISVTVSKDSGILGDHRVTKSSMSGHSRTTVQ